MASEAPAPAAQVTQAEPDARPAPAAQPAQITPDSGTVKDGIAAEQSAQAGRLIQKKPAPFRAKTVGDALERAQAALAEQAKASKAESAKVETETSQSESAKATEAPVETGKAEAPKAAEVAKTEPAEDPAAKTKEAEKQQRLSRGLAILAEREQKVMAIEKRAKAALAELEQRQSVATADPDVQLAKQLREAKAKGPGAVMQLLGLDLRAGIEQMAKEYEDPTPESVARKAAAEEFAKLQRESQERQDREKRETEERQAAQLQVTRTDIADNITREFLRAADDFPFIIENQVEANQVADWAMVEERRTGRRPSAVESLQAVEKMLSDASERALAKRLSKAKPADDPAKKPAAPAAAAQPAAKTAAPTEAQKPSQKQDEDIPAKPQRRKESEVKPLVARFQRRVDAHERARLAMKNLGIS